MWRRNLVDAGWWWRRISDVSVIQWLIGVVPVTAILSTSAWVSQWGYLSMALVALGVFVGLFLLFTCIKVLRFIQKPLIFSDKRADTRAIGKPEPMSESDRQCLDSLAEFVLGSLKQAGLRLHGIFNIIRNENTKSIEYMFIFVSRAVMLGLGSRLSTLETVTQKSVKENTLAPILLILREFLVEYKLNQDLLRKFILIAGNYPARDMRDWIDKDRLCADKFRVLRARFSQMKDLPTESVFVSAHDFIANINIELAQLNQTKTSAVAGNP